MLIVLGLGSNLGDRLLYLRRAAALMTQDADAFISRPRFSPIYESQALLPNGAPAAWDIPYFNLAMAGETTLAPDALLNAVKEVERKVGRKPTGYWGPRVIDIDILVYGNQIVNTESLVIPQRELLRRDFALIPMCDVAPTWVYPGEGDMHGKTVKEMVKLLGMDKHGLVRTPNTIRPHD